MTGILTYFNKCSIPIVGCLTIIAICIITPIKTLAQSTSSNTIFTDSTTQQRTPAIDDAYFRHKEGAHFQGLMDNGMQKVYEYTQIVYIAAGASKNLVAGKETVEGYARWYNYNTDYGMPLATSSTQGYIYKTNYSDKYKQLGTSNTSTDRGFYFTKLGSDGKFPAVTYTQTNPATSVKIACDQSVYVDYTTTTANGITC